MVRDLTLLSSAAPDFALLASQIALGWTLSPDFPIVPVMSAPICRFLSNLCFQLGVLSIGASIAIWWFNRGDSPEVTAHAERFGIFVGLWAPTLLILSNRFDRYADKANEVPGLKPEHHEENRDGNAG